MKKIFITILVLSSLLISCSKKGDPATVTTTAVTSITMTTAISGGNVTSDGGSAVSAKGICWATHSLPTLSDITSVDGVGLGAYNSYLTKLQAGTVYYVRAYATNKAGTAYGNEVSFETY